MSLISAGGGSYGEKCPDGETQEPGQNYLARGSGSKISKTTLNYILCLAQVHLSELQVLNCVLKPHS